MLIEKAKCFAVVLHKESVSSETGFTCGVMVEQDYGVIGRKLSGKNYAVKVRETEKWNRRHQQFKLQ